MSTATDDLINAYLAELTREAARLPWNARTELLEDVRSHIEVALAEMREAGGGGSRAGAAASGGAAASSGDAAGGDASGAGAGLGDGAGAATNFGDPFSATAAGGDAFGAAAAGAAAAAGLSAAGANSVTDSGDRSTDPTIAGPRDSAAEPTVALSQVRAMLAALGEPSEIVAAALADDPSLAPIPTPEPAYASTPAPSGPPHPLGTLDVTAVTLLLLGGFLAGIGWLVGAVLLWTSPRWSRIEKLIGTLVLPGGIAGGLFAFTAAHTGSHTECVADAPCVTTHTGWNPPGWLAALIIAIVVIAPAVTTVYLVTRARLRPGPAASRAALAVIAGVGAVGVLGAAGLVVASSASSAHSGSSTPLPSESSSWSGYVAPISSPAQPSPSASTP